MHNRVVIGVIGLVLSGCTFNFPLFPGPGPLQETQVDGTGKAKVLLIEISGVISSQEKDGLRIWAQHDCKRKRTADPSGQG